MSPAVGHFVGQRLLTDRRSRRSISGRRAARPKAIRRRCRALPKFADGWLLGKPDLIVKPDSRVLAARAADRRLPHLRDPGAGDEAHLRHRHRVPSRQRRASCITPTSASIARAATRTLDEADPLPGYDGLMPRSAEYPDGHFLGWTPGQIAPLVQPELAWTLEPGSDLVVQLHMQPSGAVEEVLPEIGFYFTDRTPLRAPTILRLGSQGIDIPPGESQLRDSRFVRAAGGRGVAGRSAARALPRQGDSRRRAVAGRHRRAT